MSGRGILTAMILSLLTASCAPEPDPGAKSIVRLQLNTDYPMEVFNEDVQRAIYAALEDRFYVSRPGYVRALVRYGMDGEFEIVMSDTCPNAIAWTKRALGQARGSLGNQAKKMLDHSDLDCITAPEE